MAGGSGNDVYIVDDADDLIQEGWNAGIDLVQSSITYTIGDNLENLTLTGIAAINGTGNDYFSNVITGNNGGNVLDGRAGSDTLIGGAGNDIYIVQNEGDVVVEAVNEGTDLVQASVTYSLSANVENLTLTGTNAINGTGNTLANVIVGNSVVNVLRGGAGDDTYFIGNGDSVLENSNEGVDTVISDVGWILGDNIESLTLTGDVVADATGNVLDNVLIGNQAVNVLDGKVGRDTMSGGDGNDTYIVDNVSDTVIESADNGIDHVQSSVTFVLGENVENLTLTDTASVNGTGNRLNNSLIGNAGVNTLTGDLGDDTLDGGTGADKLIGGIGDDSYTVDNTGDIVTENLNEGLDKVYSSLSYTLGSNLEALVLTGSSAINGTGNAGNNLIIGNGVRNTLGGTGGVDILQGSGGADTLNDTAGNNLLDGGDDADTITGGAGSDFIAGGRGNDTVTLGTGADVLAFNRGDGIDIVSASTGTDNTLSLGGIKYADLSFVKSRSDLILVTGTGEQITFKDWYKRTDYRSVKNLQMIVEGTTDYDASSSNEMNNKKVVQFDFNGLVSAFDQALAANPQLSSWALSSSMLNFHLSGSDTAAIGGDLAYQYARSGNLSNLSMTPAEALLAGSQFGIGSQNLQAASSLQDSSPRLI